ncbi:ABC transporter substrate-binding protein [Microbacterium sp.]|uniref:ABC transporter substrate-binding protein n=1 Tax=Microbacterium sp. TaxID=51671 RepID=UPI003C7569B3
MHSTLTRSVALTTLAAGALVLAGCSGSTPESGGASDGASEAPIGAIDLAAAGCPADVRIQTDWNPEAEHGPLYELLGEDYSFDTSVKSLTGPLMASGEYTGVDVTILAGGPAIGFASPTTQLYTDDSLLLGYVGTDDAINAYADRPTLAVLAPLEKDPQMIQWDPATYPDVTSIADLGTQDITIRTFSGQTFIDWFIGSGIVSADQVDSTYDGLPATFIAEGGKVAQQGYASAEPYIYEHEVPEWGKPVDYQLIYDAGFQRYAQTLAGKPDVIEANSDCLKALVPVLQQATVDYYASPDAANAIILAAVEAYDTGWVYSQGVADYSVETQVDEGLVGNGSNDTVGDFEADRVSTLFDQVAPIYKDAGITIPDGFSPDQLYTNEFIDPSIGF